MDKQQIMSILPHREDMLLIDEAEVKDNKAYGKKKIIGNEYFLRGHFPGNPIVPGVILCEILAQSTCVLLSDISSDSVTTLFTGLDKVKFRNQVKPGDLFETECEIINTKGPFYFAKGKGFANGKLCISAEFSFAVITRKGDE